MIAGGIGFSAFMGGMEMLTSLAWIFLAGLTMAELSCRLLRPAPAEETAPAEERGEA